MTERIRLGSYEGSLLTHEEALDVLRLMLERAGYMNRGGDPPPPIDDALAAVIDEARRTEDLEQQLGRARERIKDLTESLGEAERARDELEADIMADDT